MGLDLWFREDVRRILASTYETMRASTSAVRPEGEAAMGGGAPYEQGFVDALRAVALAFGLGEGEGRYGGVGGGWGVYAEAGGVQAASWRPGRLAMRAMGGGPEGR